MQPGVILDDLRRAAEQHGLTFGPDPATHAWCTLGGMIGNNSCGSHALFAGKTVDNVERLRIVEYGGATLEVGAYDEAAYAAAIAGGGRLAEVLTDLRRIGLRHADLVRARYPDIPRRVSGYNLDQLLPEPGFHVARALVGTESTCAVVTEATLRLRPSPRQRRLVVIGYPDVFAAADAVPSLLAHPLLALEGFDDTLIDQMRARQLNVEHLPLLPEGRGWLMAELGADDPAEADRLADAFVAGLPVDVTWRRFDDAERQARVWLVRESGLGAAAIAADGTRHLEGWEDAAVAPERLGSYLRAITALLGRVRLLGRPVRPLRPGLRPHAQQLRSPHAPTGWPHTGDSSPGPRISSCRWGAPCRASTGTASRAGSCCERMYGPVLVDAFREFKAVFDPRGRMNPGKVVDAYPLDTNLARGPGYRPSSLGPSTFAFGGAGHSLQRAAERCVGVGRCLRDDAGTMCPSFRVTRDEQHSTRGRAKLLVEMFQGETTPATWRSRDVRDALDLCLSCKGCAVDCPTQVDMAAYKAEFLAPLLRRPAAPPGDVRPRAPALDGTRGDPHAAAVQRRARCSRAWGRQCAGSRG